MTVCPTKIELLLTFSFDLVIETFIFVLISHFSRTHSGSRYPQAFIGTSSNDCSSPRSSATTAASPMKVWPTRATAARRTTASWRRTASRPTSNTTTSTWSRSAPSSRIPDPWRTSTTTPRATTSSARWAST